MSFLIEIKMTLRIFIFCVCLFTSNLTIAQSGIIRGCIIDDENAEPMFAANAGIEGTTIGASADFDGNFELSVEAGNYTIIASFIGYNTARVTDVNVEANKVTSLGNIRLKSSAVNVETVTITAEAVKNSETAILTFKKKSVNVIDGISAQSFKKMGDGDAAVAVTRVPGVSVEGGKYVYVRGLGDRYTKTMFNGLDIPGLDPDRNSLQLDIFPTNIIDNIIVKKTFTADLPGDFTGGVVDISTKSFPETPQLKVSAGLSYNTEIHYNINNPNDNFLSYNGSSTDFLAFDDGNRDLPIEPTLLDNIVDIRLSDEELVMDATKRFNSELATVRKNRFIDGSFGISGGNQKSIGDNKLGYSGALSYKNTTSFYENVQQNEFEKNDDITQINLVTNKEQTGEIGKNEVLISAMAGAALKTSKSKIKLNLLHLQNGESKAGFFIENNYESNFNTIKKENLEYTQRSISNLLLEGNHNYKNGEIELIWKISPTYSMIRDKDIRESAYEVNDNEFTIDVSNAGTPSRMWRNLNEYNIASKIELIKEHTLFNFDAKMKYGLNYTFKYRDYEILRYLINPQNVTAASNLTGDPNELLSSQLYDINTESGFYIKGEYQPSNAYTGIQSNIGAYFSEEFQLNDQLKSIAGIRIEKYDQLYTGENQSGVKYDNENVLSNIDIFPSLGLIYTLNKSSNLRGTFFRTTARPSFKEKSNAQILDVLSGITFIGNLDLIASNIYNYDMRYEYFGSGNQTFSLSSFYKALYNPIEMTAFSSDPDNIQPRNTGDARIFGLELEARSNLSFLSENLFLNLNTSVIKSEVEIIDEELIARQTNLREGEILETRWLENAENATIVREMQGQAPFLVNTGLSYKYEDLDMEAGIFYNVQGPTLTVVSMNKIPDIFTSPFHSVNINFTYNYSDETKFTFNVKNILDQDKELLTQSYGVDPLIYRSYKPGRFFSFKWTHNFK